MKTNRHGVSIEAIRNMARAANNERYRITRDDALEYYGIMPHTNQRGWYFVAWITDIKGIEGTNFL